MRSITGVALRIVSIADILGEGFPQKRTGLGNEFSTCGSSDIIWVARNFEQTAQVIHRLQLKTITRS